MARGAVREVLSDMRPRLEAARDEVDDARTALQNALERRDGLVVAAVDQGMAQNQVGRLIGVSGPQVIRILAEADRVD